MCDTQVTPLKVITEKIRTLLKNIRGVRHPCDTLKGVHWKMKKTPFENFRSVRHPSDNFEGIY